MVPDELKEAISEYANSYLGDACRIYRATDASGTRDLYLSVPLAREEQVMADIRTGHPTLQLGQVVLETRDHHLARQISDLFYA